jgi:hypothetical protein
MTGVDLAPALSKVNNSYRMDTWHAKLSGVKFSSQPLLTPFGDDIFQGHKPSCSKSKDLVLSAAASLVRNARGIGHIDQHTSELRR